MALDSFESDRLTAAADMAGQPEHLMPEPAAAEPGRVRPTLFQMVCLQGKPATEPPRNL